ncbi:MAG: thioredoxin family protein [Rhodanobacter sp.]
MTLSTQSVGILRRYRAMRLLLLVVAALALVAPGRAQADGPPRQVPDFTGINQWINSPPLSMTALRGKVVLIDFWAYSCINCLRAIPHVEHLYQAYKDHGLVVVGVHTPEYDFEKQPANVQAAARRIGISYPVAMDNDNATWNAWHNQYWPAEYLIDQNGKLIGHHYGEGDYEKMENAVRVLLGMNMLSGSVAPNGFVPGQGDTPELHFGSAIQFGFGSPESGKDGIRHFTAPPRLPLHKFALVGRWEITPEYVRLAGADGEMRLHFKAAKLYMVAGADHPVTVQVTVDGKPQPAVTVQASGQYTLFESHDDSDHVLAMHISQPDLKAYSFTFG